VYGSKKLARYGHFYKSHDVDVGILSFEIINSGISVEQRIVELSLLVATPTPLGKASMKSSDMRFCGLPIRNHDYPDGCRQVLRLDLIASE